MRVTSLPVSSPKSSSPESGGMRLKPARFRKTVTGLSARCRCLVWGIIGRKARSEEHTSELQSLRHLGCRLLLEKKKRQTYSASFPLHLIQRVAILKASLYD